MTGYRQVKELPAGKLPGLRRGLSVILLFFISIAGILFLFSFQSELSHQKKNYNQRYEVNDVSCINDTTAHGTVMTDYPKRQDEAYPNYR